MTDFSNIGPQTGSRVRRFFSGQLAYLSFYLTLTNKFTKKERGNLALLLLHVCWVVFRAKANVPNKRSRYIEERSRSNLSS